MRESFQNAMCLKLYKLYIRWPKYFFLHKTLILILLHKLTLLRLSWHPIPFYWFCFHFFVFLALAKPLNLVNWPTWVKSDDKYLLLQSYLVSSKANVIVAKDGFKNFTSVKATFDPSPKSNSRRYVIYIKGSVRWNSWGKIN